MQNKCFKVEVSTQVSQTGKSFNVFRATAIKKDGSQGGYISITDFQIPYLAQLLEKYMRDNNINQLERL